MEQFNFSNSNIDLACEEVGTFLLSVGVEKRETLRIKLTLEEILLDYQERLGEEATFKLKCVKRFMSIKVELVVEGQVYNPLEKTDEDNVIHRILAGVGLAPSYAYRNGKNYIVFAPKKKTLSGTFKMCVAVGLAVIAGIVLNLLPDTVRAGANDYVLSPMTDAFFGLLSAVSVPLIFLSVLGSIASMGNMETLGRIGSKTIKTILLYMTIVSILMTALGSLFYHIEWGSGTTAEFSSILYMFYDIIPTSLFEPFLSGNALQLIFISIIVGLAMLLLSSRVSSIFRIVEELGAIVQTIMSGLSSMFPFLIFLLFTGMISDGKLSTLLDSWKIVTVFLILIVAYYALTVLYISLRKKVSPLLLLKKIWSTFAIALSTASSAAAFQKNVSDSNRKLGIDKRLAEFGASLGQVLFSPSDVAILLAMELGFAEMYGIAITPQMLLIALITNLLLSFSIPPVAGGAVVGYAIAFTQFGIPLEVMGVVLALDAIIDFPATACNVSGWQLTMINVADSIDMLDRKKLLKDNEK